MNNFIVVDKCRKYIFLCQNYVNGKCSSGNKIETKEKKKRKKINVNRNKYDLNFNTIKTVSV